MRFFYKVTKKRKKIPKLLILFCFVVFVGYFFWGGISNIDYKDAIFCLKYNYKKGKYQIVSIDGSLSKIRILKETHKDYSSLYHDIKNQRLFVRRSYDGRSPELIDAYSYKTSQLSSYIKTPGIHDVSLHKSNENLAIFSGIHDSGDLFLSIYGETGKLLHEEIIAPKTLSTASAENNKHLYFISYPHPYPKIKYEIPEFIEYDIESRKIIKKKPLPVKHIRSGKAFAIDLSRKNLFYGPFATDKEGGLKVQTDIYVFKYPELTFVKKIKTQGKLYKFYFDKGTNQLVVKHDRGVCILDTITLSIKKRYPLALERMAKVHGPYMALNLSGYEWIWGQNGDENRIVKKGNPKIVLYNLKTYQFEKEIEGDFGPIAEKVDL